MNALNEKNTFIELTCMVVGRMRAPLLAAVLGGLPWMSAVSGDQSADAQGLDDRILVIEGLAGPEAVHWDAEQAVWFISNFNGSASGDANGFVSRVAGDGRMVDREFMTGTEQHPLHGPRGMRIQGERLWVADADGLHAFDRRSGRQLQFVDFTAFEPGFLNDIEIGPDGGVYVTDTGQSRVYRWVDGEIAIVAGEELDAPPNGIVWHPATDVLVLAPWGGARDLQGLRPTQHELVRVGTLPAGGNMDGLESWRNGLLVASQDDQSIWFMRGKEAKPLIRTPGRPADIGLDREGKRIAVPYIALDRVDIWALSGVDP